MGIFINIAKGIDWLNNKIGQIVIWLTLLVAVISASNAIVRKVFHVSSNAWLEIQWYLFGAIFLLASGYTFLKNEHVRVDILNQKMSKKWQLIIDIIGVVFFIIPAFCLVIYLSWPFFIKSYFGHEMSSNSGGLLRWPVKLLLPVGFTLLVLAGISHLIKCVAALMGKGPNPLIIRDTTEEIEELADSILEQHEDIEIAESNSAVNPTNNSQNKNK